TSLAAAGLDLVARRHFPVSGRRALLIGTGSFARVATGALRDRGCHDITVYSSSGRAAHFAALNDVSAVDLDGLDGALAASDLGVLSSGKRRAHPILSTSRVAAARTATTVMTILDLSLRADIAPEVADLAGVDVIDLDEVGAHLPGAEKQSLVAAQQLVAERVESFLCRESGRSSASAVTMLRNHVSAYIEREVEVASHRYDPATAAAIARSLHRVSNSLLHTPSVRAADFARHGSLDEYQVALNTVFGIDVHP
ncbi:MAG: hypothetical protein ACK5KO_08670, partial [Arachnia sp.]